MTPRPIEWLQGPPHPPGTVSLPVPPMPLVEWLSGPPDLVLTLGQESGNGSGDAEEIVEKTEVETSEELSTSEKILIVSLFLNVATFAWTIYKSTKGS